MDQTFENRQEEEIAALVARPPYPRQRNQGEVQRKERKPNRSA